MRDDWSMGALAAQDEYRPLGNDPWTNTMRGTPAAPGQGFPAPLPSSPVLFKTKAGDITEADIDRGMDVAMGVSGGGMTVKGPKGIKAYHSSPHDFDKFDLAKIGTGEGAQTYGHGLYFAENPAVSGQGGQYWDQFSHRFMGPEGKAMEYLKEAGFDREKAIASLRKGRDFMAEQYPGRDVFPRDHKVALDLLESGKPVGPRTYEVNINADPAHMLDWDKPLSKQSEHVRAALPDIVKADELYRARYPHSPMADPFGSNIYTQVGATGGLRIPDAKAQAAAALREAGIPGIKYLDQGSRSKAYTVQPTYKGQPYGDPVHFDSTHPAERWAKEQREKGFGAEVKDTGSRNYVVFDPSIIDIMKKYGLAGAAPAGMGALAAQDYYRNP